MHPVLRAFAEAATVLTFLIPLSRARRRSVLSDMSMARRRFLVGRVRGGK
jgi:hypothetical protein